MPFSENNLRIPPAADGQPATGTEAVMSSPAQIASELPPLVADVPERPGRVLSPLTLRALVGVFDAAIVALGFLGATAIAAPDMADIDLLPMQLPVVCTLMVMGLTLQGAYEFKRIRNGHQVLSRLTLGSIIGLGLVILASYVLPEITVARR